MLSLHFTLFANLSQEVNKHPVIEEITENKIKIAYKGYPCHPYFFRLFRLSGEIIDRIRERIHTVLGKWY